MARLRKSSVLVCLALLCQVAMGTPNNRDTSWSSSVEESRSEEGRLPSPAIEDDGRARTYIFSRDRSAQRERAQKLAPDITNPIQPIRTVDQGRQTVTETGEREFIPLPEQPPFLANSSRVVTTHGNTNRNVTDVTHRIPGSAGAIGSNVGTIIYDENVQPAEPIDRQTQSQETSNYNPSRPSSTAQNFFPIGTIQPPVILLHQSNPQSGLNVPIASGGFEPPIDHVPRNQLFVHGNFGGSDHIKPVNTQPFQGSFRGGDSPNLLPSRNTNNDFGSSTGSFNDVGSPNAFPSRNTNTNFGVTEATTSGASPIAFPSQNTSTNFGSTGSSNGGGSPSVFPFQNTNNNFGSSTESFHDGSSQQPSTGSIGSPTNRFPTKNNLFPGSDSTNQFHSKNNDKFGGGQAYPENSAVVNGIQKFTLDLLATFGLGSQGNVVYSPVSISSLLSLLTLATNGNSKREIEVALFPLSPSSSNDHHNEFEIILGRLNQLSQGIIISTSSRLFIEQSVNISGTFANGAMKHYNCSVSIENFSGQPEMTMTHVNNWAEEKTRGKITEFIGQPFSSDTKFVAANTIYFDGKWAKPFPELFTTERDFDTGYEIIQIPMMTNEIETPHYYSKEFNVDVTSLPYSGGEFAMIIILPRESPRVRSIMDLEKQLNTTTIENLVNNLSSKSISISLPKMKLAMKTSLVKNLSELRIRSIFSSAADFSSMTDTKPLFVSEFLHEAVMEVTELGTVAAAASAVSFNRMSRPTIIVNKPAIIFIRDMATGVPLFWTRLVKPERVPESGQKKTPLPTKF